MPFVLLYPAALRFAGAAMRTLPVVRLLVIVNLRHQCRSRSQRRHGTHPPGARL